MKSMGHGRGPNLRRAYFESRFGQLHCRTAFPSTGGFDELTPLVCLHDTPGSGAALADLLWPLGMDRSVYIPDIPGCGLSDAPRAPASIAEYAQAIGEMLTGLRLREVDLLGVGVGAAIAIELALWLAAGARRLVLADLPLEGTPAAAVTADAHGNHLAALWRVGAPEPDSDAAAVERHSRRLGERLAAGAAALWPALALPAWPHRQALAGLALPTLLLERDGSRGVLKTLVPSAKLEVFAAAGRLHGDDLSANLRRINAFLDG